MSSGGNETDSGAGEGSGQVTSRTRSDSPLDTRRTVIIGSFAVVFVLALISAIILVLHRGIIKPLGVKNASSTQPHHFVHVSDIHLDPLYNPEVGGKKWCRNATDETYEKYIHDILGQDAFFLSRYTDIFGSFKEKFGPGAPASTDSEVAFPNPQVEWQENLLRSEGEQTWFDQGALPAYYGRFNCDSPRSLFSTMMSSISGVMNGRIVPRGPEPAGEDADDDEKIFLSANFLRGASVRKLSNLLSAASEVAPSTTGGSDLRDGQKPDVRFLISTGDLVAHNLEAATKNATLVRLARFAIVRDVSKQIRAALEVGGRPQIPFVQVIGNNDLDGDYAIPFTEEEREWYLELYNAMKGFSIPEDDEEIKKDFLKGGYYSQRVVEASGDQGGEGVLPGSQRSGLRVISLNTNYWSTTAWKKKQMEPPEDPEDQFEWLEGTLRRAQEAGESVIIAGHVPPGFNAVFKIGVDFEVQFLPKYQKRLTDILKKFKEIVVAGIFGHYHRDSLRIILETEGTPNSKALIPIILGGSLTPQSGNNPTWRLFSYSPSAVTFQNAFQFFSDLFSFGILGSYNPPDTQDVTTLDRSANEEPQTEDNDDLGPSKMGPSWELEYEFRRTYETPDMSAASVQKAIEMALSQSSHYRTFVDREEAQPSSPDFLKACMLTSLSLETMTECVKNALPDPSLADTPNRAVAGRRQKKKTFPATTRRVFPVATAKSVNKSKRSWKVSQKTPQTVY